MKVFSVLAKVSVVQCTSSQLCRLPGGALMHDGPLTIVDRHHVIAAKILRRASRRSVNMFIYTRRVSFCASVVTIIASVALL